MACERNLRPRYRHGASAIVCLFAMAGMAGCGGSAGGQPSGRVTHDGQPVAGAEMTFLSADNDDVIFSGISSADGVYRVDYRGQEGMPPGTYHVTIRRYSLPGGKPLPEGEEGNDAKLDGKAIVTAVTFDQEIVAGDNPIDFELTKGRKRGA